MNQRLKLHAALGAFALALVASPAIAVVLTFEDLSHEYELQGVGDEIATRGYTLLYTPAPDEPNPVGFTAVGRAWSFNTKGSTAVVANSCSALTTLTADNHALMSLASIDLAELNGDLDVSAQFTGVRADGTTVQTEFRLNGRMGWQTFHFPKSFRNLRSVSWLQGDCVTNHPHMFDNISVSAAK